MTYQIYHREIPKKPLHVALRQHCTVMELHISYPAVALGRRCTIMEHKYYQSIKSNHHIKPYVVLNSIVLS